MSGNAGNNRPGFSALLIGVPYYKAEDFPTIATVPNDLHQLRLALESSGYEGQVRVYPEIPEGDGSAQPLVTGSDISHELRNACENAPEDGVLFLYFSGHGVSRDNHDYLVPGDMRSLADALEDPQFLVSVDLSRYLKACKARAVVLAVDACRDNMEQGKGVRLQAADDFGYGAVDPAHKTRIATIYGCDREQFCYFSGELKMSLFTRALCTVLSPEHKAQKLSEVIASTDEVLQTLVRKYKPGRTQRVHVLHEGGAGSIDDQVICEGSADPWRAAIRDSPLWELATDTSAEQIDTFRSLAESIASDVWNEGQANAARMPDDPWRDAYHFPRCLSALELLIPPHAELSVAEILVLTTAPILAEATYAEGVRQLLEHDPLDLSAGLSSERRRQELEAVHSAYSRVAQKAATLVRTQPTDAAALAIWLMYRCIFRQVRLWREEPTSQLSQRLAAGLDQRAGFRGGHAAAIRGVASFLGTGAEELEAFLQGSAEGDRIAAGKDAEIELASGQRVRVRGRMMAALLSIAGLLALDLRRFGEVVVDHVGIRDPLDPADLRRAVREAKWVLSSDSTTLGLEARCIHPATHLALREICEVVQQQLHVVHRWAKSAGEGGGLLASLPLSVSTDDLEPELDSDGHQVYETPLLQFRLAHNEIRDLLMGARLYGDPALAVRELYQNALDACRYRSVRARFRGQPYQGRIRINQGIEDGRPYIECIDNGVGMGRRELENTFSRAGRRFVTSTEFLWEQAEWLRVDDSLRLWPNSQFGIGVFSYFMLADEIFVETAQIDRATNAPGPLLHVQISSSGSLFRITSAEHTFQRRNDVATNGGTRIRLYLRDQEADRVSCEDTLRRLLWYSEFDVEVSNGGARRTWDAGILNPPEEVGSTYQGGPDIWWVGGRGMLLADGIATDETPFGYVANLAGENRPLLSVDRNKLEGWNKDWLRGQLLASADQVPSLRHFSFVWLQEFALQRPEIAQTIVTGLIKRDATLLVGAGRRESAKISEAGLWPADAIYLDGTSTRPYLTSRTRWDVRQSHLDASRAKVWHDLGVNVSRDDYSATWSDDSIWVSPADTQGHPFLEPIDGALVLPQEYEYGDEKALGGLLELSHVTRAPVAELLRRVRRFIIHGAVPPPAIEGDLNFIADEIDARMMEGLRYSRSILPGAAKISYQADRPLAYVIDRMRLYAALLRLDDHISTVPWDIDAEYVCGAVDAALLTDDFSGHAYRDEYASDWRWLRLLLNPGIPTRDVKALMRTFHVPLEPLQRLVEAAFTDDLLVQLLSSNADSSNTWLFGEVSLLHLLIGSAVAGEPPAQVAADIAPYGEVLGFRLPADLSLLPPDPVPAQAAVLLRLLNNASVPSDEDLELAGSDPAANHLLTALLSYESGLSPRSVLAILAPYRACLRTTLPLSVSGIPDRVPTEEEAKILATITANDLRTSPMLLAAAAGSLDLPLPGVQEVAHRWQVPVRDAPPAGTPPASSAGGQLGESATGDYLLEDLTGIEARDRTLLSRDLDGLGPYLCGTLSPAHLVGAALANRESVNQTIERVTRLPATFKVSAPEFDWGELRHATLPGELSVIRPGAFEPAAVIEGAYSMKVTVAAILRPFTPIADALGFPSLSPGELLTLNHVPDEWDVAALAPIRVASPLFRGRQRYRQDHWHVIRVAGRLGVTIGAVSKRIAAFAPILEAPPPTVPADAEGLVPDWRDLVILTPRLDGERLVTDADLTDAHIAQAAHEVGTTAQDVRLRLSRYASYCGFTAPAVPST